MPARGLIVSAALVAGIIAADAIRPQRGLALAAGLVSASLLMGSWLIHSRSPSPNLLDLLPRLRLVTIGFFLGGFVAAGFMLAGLRLHALDHSMAASMTGRVTELRGILVSDPEPRGRSTIAIIRASSLGEATVRERIELRWADHPKVRLGDEIALDVRLQGLNHKELFDRILYRRSVAARAIASGSIEVIEKTANPVIRASNTLRSKMEDAAKKGLSPPDAGLLMGLTVGDRRGMGDELQDKFRSTGLSHLTAVSGANVAMVLGALFVLLRLLKVSRGSQIITGITMVCFFAVVTRWEPSVMRACLMASIALAAFLFGRISNPLNALGVAAAVLLLIDPFLVWSVAFQLSVAATIGILLVSPRIRDQLKLPRLAAEPLAIVIGAQVFVIPLVAFHFGTISIVSLPANLLAAPLVPPATVIGFIGGAISLIAETPARLVLSLAAPPVFLLRLIASGFGSLPFSSTEVFGSRWIFLAAGYLVILAFLFRSVTRRRTARLVAVVGTVLVGFAFFVPRAAPAPQDAMRITFFDVGQGDAALVESPGGARILIDGGPHPTDVATRLMRRGVDRLDLVVFSHAHQDHVRGLDAIVKRIPVRLAIHPGIDNLLVRAIGGMSPSEDGELFEIGDVAAVVLGPDDLLRESAIEEVFGSISGEGSALNDASLVLRLAWRGSCALFPGDLEEAGQERLLRAHATAVNCEVLKAPHHGSAKLLDEFVRAVNPKTTVISVGPNSFGHPTRKAITLFERNGSKVLRTDHEGDVVVEIGRTV